MVAFNISCWKYKEKYYDVFSNDRSISDYIREDSRKIKYLKYGNFKEFMKLDFEQKNDWVARNSIIKNNAKVIWELFSNSFLVFFF